VIELVGQHTFRSMGCEIVVAGASASTEAAIERLFESRNLIFSRFLEDSELTRVNAAAGRPIRVSQVFANMLSLALEAAHETGGLVDPTFGAELEAAGYDDDFALLADERDVVPIVHPTERHRVRLAGKFVMTASSVMLDLNGVVKGRTVDDALALLDGEGFVSAGGDIAARGPLVVGLPGGGAVKLVRGSLATSGSDRRRWIRGGTLQHHLIDPRTGAPSRSPWQQVTVCGDTCVAADVAAKAAYLQGPAGPGWLDERGLPGRFLSTDGEIEVNRSWGRMLENGAACI
jgi:FAD:protein FMN transferase